MDTYTTISQLTEILANLKNQGTVFIDIYATNDTGANPTKIRNKEKVDHIPGSVQEYFTKLESQFGKDHFLVKIYLRETGQSNPSLNQELLLKIDPKQPESTQQPKTSESTQPSNMNGLNQQPQTPPPMQNDSMAMFMANQYKASLDKAEAALEKLKEKHEKLTEEHRDLKLDHNTQQQKFDLQLQGMKVSQENSLNGVVDKIAGNQELMELASEYVKSKMSNKNKDLEDVMVNSVNKAFIESVSAATLNADSAALSLLANIVPYFIEKPGHLKKTHDHIIQIIQGEQSQQIASAQPTMPEQNVDMNGINDYSEVIGEPLDVL